MLQSNPPLKGSLVSVKWNTIGSPVLLGRHTIHVREWLLGKEPAKNARGNDSASEKRRRLTRPRSGNTIPGSFTTCRRESSRHLLWSVYVPTWRARRQRDLWEEGNWTPSVRGGD